MHYRSHIRICRQEKQGGGEWLSREEAVHRGSVIRRERLSGALLTRAANAAAFLLLFSHLRLAGATDPPLTGQYSAVQQLAFAPVHSVLLPTGKVLFWPSFALGNNPQLWDPATGTVTSAPPAPYNPFCGGHSLLANGKVLVTGGDYSTEVGVPNATIYDPIANAWIEQPEMNAGRWYPTNTTLGNGDVLVVAGEISPTLGNDTLPQVYQAASGTWRDLTSAQLNLPTYPSMFLTDTGLVFNSGHNQECRFINPTGTGAWTVGPSSNYGPRDYGPAVMYDDGKILLIGGGDPPTNTAEVIDLNVPVPAWRYTNPMNYPRRQANAILLPDGTVLVTGGSSGSGFDNSASPVYPAELWNPATETWTIMDSLAVYRGYHSTAVLLPDGRIFSGGGNANSMEVYSPPYLFKGTRPTITSAPATIVGGQIMFVATPDAASITAVNWLRIGATTHTFDENQRINHLSFAQASGGLNIVTPSNPNLAPPGDYMLFLLNGNGVPSIATFVNVSYSSFNSSSLALSVTHVLMKTPIVIGSTSAPQSVSLTNLGSSAVSISGITFSGPDFALSNSTCGTSLAATSTCQITVVEKPSIAGIFNETMSINDADVSSPQVVSLSGVGTALTASPTSFNAGTSMVGVTSPNQPKLTLTNKSSAPIAINSLTYSNAQFAEYLPSSTCGSSLAAGASCLIYSTFTPSAAGPQTATLSIASSDPASPIIITLNGTGSAVQTTPNHYAWGTQPINATTPPQKITVANLGSASLTISGIAITGTNSSNFAVQSSTCGSALAAAATCSISITFTPTALVTYSANLTITDSDPTSPQQVSLSGAGGKGISSIALTPATATINVGTTQQFTATATYSDGTTGVITNSATWSSSAASVATVSATGLATGIAQGSATISAVEGSVTGSASLKVSAGTTAVAVTPASLTFALQNVGTTSTTQPVTLKNGGTASLTISSMLFSGRDFITSSTTCGTSLGAGSSCQINVAFKPTSGGTLSETLSISDSDPSSPQTVALKGIGSALTASSTSLNLGTSSLGTPSATKSAVTLTNSGSQPIAIASLTYSNPEFSQYAPTSTCGSSVPASANCAVASTFTPNAINAQTGTLTITDSDGRSPTVITLHGTGTAVQLVPNHYTWGSRPLNTTTPPQSMTLTNAGSVTLNLSSVAITGTNSASFAIQSTTCGSQVTAGASCIISITFTPLVSGANSAFLTITDDGGASPQQFALNGTGGS